MRGEPDLNVLAKAASENRIVISHDRRTMPYHFAEFIQNQKSSGLFIVSQKAPVSKVAKDIVLIWFASEPEEWINLIGKLPFR